MKNSSKNYYYDNFNKYFYIIIFILIILPFLIQPILYLTTKFTKTVTITQKYVAYRTYVVVDENNNRYHLSNVWFALNFNAIPSYDSIIVGRQYTINGYGYEFLPFNTYKKIYSVKPSTYS